MPSVVLGLFLHAVGGFAAASFYAPLKLIRNWPWESYYLVMGLFAWLAAPWLFGFATVPGLLHVLAESPPRALGMTVLFGAVWGVGAVTYGLAMRYLGMALGMSVILGFCAIFGTLCPPLIEGELGQIADSAGGRWVLFGVGLCFTGILASGAAGVSKERDHRRDREQGSADRQDSFSLVKGLIVALVSGLMSACFAFGFQSGASIAELARANGAHPLFVNNGVLCVILVGGVFTNTLWCLVLNWRNRSFGSYRALPATATRRVLLLTGAAGFIWYLQFFFYGMGMTKMGSFEFSSWSLHMSSIIIFGNLWGLVFKEWRGVSRRTAALVWAGLCLLVLSTITIGWGNALGDGTAAS